jgi:hypothetical protein
MKKTILTFLTILFVTQMALAQIGIGTTTPDASAILDVSSSTKGFLFPRMTTSERDAIVIPAIGLTIFNITSNTLEINRGTTLAPLWTATATDFYTADGTLNANRNVGMDTNNISFTGNKNGGTLLEIQNNSNTNGAFVHFQLSNNIGIGLSQFINSTNRSADGGPSTATIRNDAGNLRLHSRGSNGIVIKEDSGQVGIGTETPTANLEVVGTTKTTDLQVTNGAVAGKILTSDATGNATWQDATGLKYLGKLQTDVGSSGTPMINNNTMTTLTWFTPYIDYASSLSPDGQTITIPAGVSKVRITARIAFIMFALDPSNVFHKAKGIISLNGNDYGWSSMRVSTNQNFLLFNGWNFSSPLLDVAPGDAIQVKAFQNNGLDYGLNWGSENNTFLVVEYYK